MWRSPSQDEFWVSTSSWPSDFLPESWVQNPLPCSNYVLRCLTSISAETIADLSDVPTFTTNGIWKSSLDSKKGRATWITNLIVGVNTIDSHPYLQCLNRAFLLRMSFLYSEPFNWPTRSTYHGHCGQQWRIVPQHLSPLIGVTKLISEIQHVSHPVDNASFLVGSPQQSNSICKRDRQWHLGTTNQLVFCHPRIAKRHGFQKGHHTIAHVHWVLDNRDMENPQGAALFGAATWNILPNPRYFKFTLSSPKAPPLDPKLALAKLFEVYLVL